ncbi:protein TAP1 [Capsicum galapagoense]
MALKVVMVLFLAMLVLTEHNAMAQEKLDPICMAKCVLKCGKKPWCLTKCIAGCVLITNTDESVDIEVATRNHVCNIGCSFGHCSKFLVQYDNEKFESCMTNCSEKYCFDNALEKAAA